MRFCADNGETGNRVIGPSEWWLAALVALYQSNSNAKAGWTIMGYVSVCLCMSVGLE